jgi:uncharacterized protein YbjT (DUF2867 family)
LDHSKKEIQTIVHMVDKENAMKIAIATPAGHVGRVVTNFLMGFNGDVQVKLLARRTKNLEKFLRKGAEMAIGSLDDANYLVSATRDVHALFWATPPGFGSDNVRAFQNRLGLAAAYAIRINQIPRVVNLSSIGAQLESGVGPISGLYDVEGLWDDTATNITHLRPGFFFENLLMQLEPMRKWGRISLPLSGSRQYPMIATRDIGRVAGERLLETNWTGHYLRELHGPADLSFDEVAGILSQVLGSKIVYIPCNRQQARQAFLESGMTENFADLLLEMYDALERGRLQPLERRSPQTTTPTTLADFAREFMLPLITQTMVR